MTYVPLILGANGEKFTIPRQIAQKFGNFYSSLYNLQIVPPDQLAVDEYLASSGMPGLTITAQQELESPITLEELEAAGSSAKAGKAPGLDGFTACYYKLLLPTLGPYLVKMFNGLSDSICTGQYY